MALNIRDLTISSPDIATGGSIDPRFSAEGGNDIPRLEVSGVPSEAVELAVIVNDPDAPLPHGFTHWTVYNLPARNGLLDAGTVNDATTGKNGMGETAYSGPQPPPGHGIHHYYFWVYAMDIKVEGTPNREEFFERYASNIVEQNRFVATFENS
jgi:Raf kinase inhibitor-like YbhB/YbcL family protein